MTEEIIQGSDQWKALRLGRLTASRMSDMMAKTKAGWGASRANLLSALVIERLTQTPQDNFTNEAMRWGTEQEPQARALYELMTDCTVDQVAFVEHPRIAMSGASPDGLIGVDGLLEIKAPNSSTHIDTLLNQTVPEKYRLQMSWQMACTGRKWCDFVSFDPRLPPSMQLFIQRFNRDDVLIRDLEKQAEIFLAEVDDTLAKLRAQYAEAEAA